MPPQKPGRSKQDYGTPWELIRAIEARWGKLSVDLAANESGINAKAHRWLWDSFDCDWHTLGGLLWLNPPFSDITPWVEKCKLESERGAKIIMLVPASIGANWFADHVYGNAYTIGLRPRLTFEGCKDPYPKDCMLLLWGFGGDLTIDDDPSLSLWRWK